MRGSIGGSGEGGGGLGVGGGLAAERGAKALCWCGRVSEGVESGDAGWDPPNTFLVVLSCRVPGGVLLCVSLDVWGGGCRGHRRVRVAQTLAATSVGRTRRCRAPRRQLSSSSTPLPHLSARVGGYLRNRTQRLTRGCCPLACHCR